MNTIAWITGAASGIGKEIALVMHQRGYKLILSDVNEKELSDLARNINADVLIFDVNERVATLEAGAKIKAKYGHVDLVILNAGRFEPVDVTHFNSTIIKNLFETNFFGMIYGVEASLPLLRESSHPHLVAMSSMMTNYCLPSSEAYGASKAAIYNFFKGLRLDLAKEKIFVSTILPGFIRTPLTEKLNIPNFLLYEVDKAAKKIVNGIERRKSEIRIPKLFYYFITLLNYIPDKIVLNLLDRMNNKDSRMVNRP